MRPNKPQIELKVGYSKTLENNDIFHLVQGRTHLNQCTIIKQI